MRTWRYGTVLSLAVIVIAGVYWYAGTRSRNKVTTSSDLSAELVRYRAEGNNWRMKCEIANNVAASQTHLWEACSRRIRAAREDEHLPLAHFASAYFKRGPQQEEELVSLLHSQDVQLVRGLLCLLGDCVDLGPNGEWQLDKGLGGSEIAHHIASVYKAHPTLGSSVASTLGIYGPAAKGEVVTLLRIALSPNWVEVFQAKMALLQIDRYGAYSQFIFDQIDEPLTNEQRIAIEKYLALHGGV